MFGARRHARLPVNLRLRLQLATGELETTTEDASLAGFSAPCAELPEVGTRFGFVVYLPDGRAVSGTASAMRVAPDGLAGFSCEFEPTQLPLWEAFVSQESDSGGLWRMLARYARGGDDDALAPRAVVEREKAGAHGVVRLHMVGENGEAYRVAFEKHQSESPEAVFAQAAPASRDFLRRVVSRVLSQPVLLKRAPHSEVELVRLVEMSRGGYGYLVTHPGGKPGLMGLHGAELIAVEVDGSPVFPFFDEADLERVASDTFRRETPATGATAETPVGAERFSPAYAHRRVDSRAAPETLGGLRALMAASHRVQSRTYGERTLRLFPDVWLEARRPDGWPGALRGFAVEDGEALCLFSLEGEGAPRVVRLEGGDALSVIRSGVDG